MNSFDQATFENFNTGPGNYRQRSLLNALKAVHAFATRMDRWFWLYRPDNKLDEQAHQILVDILLVSHVNSHVTLLSSLQKPETLFASLVVKLASTCDFVEMDAPDYRRRPVEDKK